MTEQCQDFHHRYCDKAAECAQSTNRADYQDSCLFALDVYVQCDQFSQAFGVDECLTSIDMIPCETVPTGAYPDYPDSCRGIFEP